MTCRPTIVVRVPLVNSIYAYSTTALVGSNNLFKTQSCIQNRPTPTIVGSNKLNLLKTIFVYNITPSVGSNKFVLYKGTAIHS